MSIAKTNEHGVMALFLLFVGFFYFDIVNSSTCYDPGDCSNETIVVGDSIYCDGYMSCAGVKTKIESTSRHVELNGAFAAKYSQLLKSTSDSGSTYCEGGQACAFSSSIIADDSIYASGTLSAAYATVTQTPVLLCEGIKSCWNTIVHNTKTIWGSGPYSMNNIVIYGNNSEYTSQVDIILEGYYAGFNSIVYCTDINTLCNISCISSNSCNQMYVAVVDIYNYSNVIINNCKSDINACIYACPIIVGLNYVSNSDTGQLKLVNSVNKDLNCLSYSYNIRNNKTISLVDRVVDNLYNISQYMDNVCSSSRGISRDSFYGQDSCTAGYYLMNNNGSVCCRGRYSCANMCNVSIIYDFNNISDFLDANLDYNINCNGIYSCTGAVNISNSMQNMNLYINNVKFIENLNKFNILCTGGASCMYTQIYGNQFGYILCNTCDYSTIYNSVAVICNDCISVTVYNCTNIYYLSGNTYYGNVHTERKQTSNVYFLNSQSGYDVNVECVAWSTCNVYCVSINACHESITTILCQLNATCTVYCSEKDGIICPSVSGMGNYTVIGLQNEGSSTTTTTTITITTNATDTTHATAETAKETPASDKNALKQIVYSLNEASTYVICSLVVISLVLTVVAFLSFKTQQRELNFGYLVYNNTTVFNNRCIISDTNWSIDDDDMYNEMVGIDTNKQKPKVKYSQSLLPIRYRHEMDTNDIIFGNFNGSRVSYFIFIQIGLKLYDIFADISYILYLFYICLYLDIGHLSNEYPIALATVLLISYLLNFVIIKKIFKMEFSKSTKKSISTNSPDINNQVSFKNWFNQSSNSYLLKFLCSLSIFNLNIIEILFSYNFNIPLFCAPFSVKSVRLLKILSFYSNLLQALPLLVVQIIVYYTYDYANDTNNNVKNQTPMIQFGSFVSGIFQLVEMTMTFMLFKTAYDNNRISSGH